MPAGPEQDNSKSNVLRADTVVVRYGGIEAVHGISVDLNRGGFLLILGPNGAGKTSFVSALAGIVRVASGSVFLDGADVTSVSAVRRVGLGIALVPEGRGVLKGLTVRENLFLGWNASVKSKRRAFVDGVEEVGQIFPRLLERLAQDCSTLSGGEMQMLAVARAMLCQPKVLLLDEPSLGLAPLAVKAVYEALGALSQHGMTLVVVEQKNVPLFATPDRTLVLREGNVLFDMSNGRPSEAQLAEIYLGREG